MNITLTTLRAEMPQWIWRAERKGMGWVYEGRFEERCVRIYQVAVLCGPTDDDYASVWRVDDGGVSIDYATFWMRES